MGALAGVKEFTICGASGFEMSTTSTAEGPAPLYPVMYAYEPFVAILLNRTSFGIGMLESTVGVNAVTATGDESVLLPPGSVARAVSTTVNMPSGRVYSTSYGGEVSVAT